MKQIIFFILFSVMAFGQMTNEQKLLIILGGDDKVYEPEVTAFQNALTTKLSLTTLDTLNQFVVKLKDSLSLAHNSLTLQLRYDRLWLLWLPTIESSLKDFIYLGNSTNENGLKYTAWKGYGGDTNTVKRIKYNYNPTTNGVVYKLNNASLGIFSLTNVLSTFADIVATSGSNFSQLVSCYTGNKFYGSINDASVAFISNSNTIGYFSTSRANATQVSLTVDGISQTVSTVSIALPNANFVSGYTPRLYPLAFIGNSRTSAEALSEYRVFNWLKLKEGW